MKTILITLLLILLSVELSSQNLNDYSAPVNKGIAINYGYGGYSVKDEYISTEKYSGHLPFFSLSWGNRHNKYGYTLEFEYRYSDEVDNFNVSTSITQFSINQGFIYPLKRPLFLGNEMDLWIGPDVGLFVFANDQNIAVDGFEYSLSFAGLFSTGIKIVALYPVGNKLFIKSALNTSLLSFGYRMVDSEEDDRSPVKLLTFLSGSNSSFDLGIGYRIFGKLSLNTAYRFELFRISSWDPVISASDNMIVGFNYTF